MRIRQMLNVAKWQSGVGTNRILGTVTRKSRITHLKRLKNTFEWTKRVVYIF